MAHCALPTIGAAAIAGRRAAPSSNISARATRGPEAAAARDWRATRQAGAVLACALSLALTCAAGPARADETQEALRAVLAKNRSALQDSASSSTEIFWGNGCFWGRQKDFIDTELRLGRSADAVTARVGYAGGATPSQRVCYYYSSPDTVYEKLGHAEVVQVSLRNEAAESELREFAKTYFSQFKRTPLGMMRLDPQDVGAGYRNVIGLPGGIRSPLMKIIQEENVYGMELVEGTGNMYDNKGLSLLGGRAREDDAINRVYVMDTDKFAFNQAEVYHQFHNGIGKTFPSSYTRDLKAKALERGLIAETGCPELPF